MKTHVAGVPLGWRQVCELCGAVLPRLQGQGSWTSLWPPGSYVTVTSNGRVERPELVTGPMCRRDDGDQCE